MKKDTYKSNYFIVTVFEKKQEIQYHTVILQPMKEPYRMAYIFIYQFSKIFLFHVKKRMTAYFSNAIIFSKYGKTLESVIFFAGGIVLRSDIEMMNTIINIAESDDRILAAYLKGSRTNPKVPKDIYRDFDVMYVVTETESFIQNTKWLNGFGETVLKQEQDDDFGYGERFGIRNHYDESYSWLLLFKDGNRIDIGVEVLSTM